MFTWLTADTRERIPVDGSRPVYMIRPDKAEPRCEENYSGNGHFDGVDAFLWLGIKNVPASYKRFMSEPDLIAAGMSLECGVVYREVKTGKIWSLGTPDLPYLDVKIVERDFSEPCPELGNKSMEELVKVGEFDCVAVSSIYDVRYPLKFSFDANAVYEDLPASTICCI